MESPVRSSITLSLVDPITQETYKIIVAPEDAEKAGQDLVFATQLFKQAKLQAAVSAKQAAEARAPAVPKALPVGTRIAVIPKALPVGTRIVVVPKALPAITTAELVNSDIISTPSRCSYKAKAETSASESCTENVEIPDEKDEGDCIWKKPMVMLLIRTYKETELNFISGKMSQKRAWEQLSDAMSTKGYTVPGSKCASKFSSLKRTYKSVKDHNNKSGNERRTWYFLDLMDELFSSKPWMEPVSTASSDSQNKSDAETSSSTSDSSIRQKATRERKRASDSLMERLIEEKRKYAEQKKLQHNEKIREARRLSRILEKLLAKKTPSRFSELTSDFDENDTSD